MRLRSFIFLMRMQKEGHAANLGGGGGAWMSCQHYRFCHHPDGSKAWHRSQAWLLSLMVGDLVVETLRSLGECPSVPRNKARSSEM